MNTKSLVFLGLFIVLAMTVSTRVQKSPEQKQWNQIKNGSTWGKVILKMAELKDLTGGAIGQLQTAIADLIVDLNTKSQKADQEFVERTTDHESEVKRLGDDIDSANLDISQNKEFLDTVLYINRDDLEASIVSLEEQIESTKEYMIAQEAERETSLNEFNVRQTEHQDAVSAIEECLELINTLVEQEGGELSFAQVSTVKQQFERVQSKLGKDADSSLVSALVQLAASDFADPSQVTQVVDLLNDVKNNLIGSIAKEQEEEAASVEAYENDMKESQASINTWILEKTDATGQLERCNESIENTEQFVAEREQDLSDFEADLEDENTRFQEATDFYNALVVQLNKELTACETALELVENAGFADYIADRTDQNVVVDQPHGMDFRTYDETE